MATRKSLIATAGPNRPMALAPPARSPRRLGVGWQWLSERCALGPRFLSGTAGRSATHGVIEISEELRIRAEHQAGIASLQRRLIGLHGAVEPKEIRVLVEGRGIGPVPLGVALALDALRFAGGVGLDHRHLAVGRGADAPRRALAFGTPFGGLALPLGLHPAIDRLHVGLRQVDALDTDIDDLDAERLGFGVHLARDGAHQFLAPVAHDGGEGRAAENAAQRGLKHRAKPQIGGRSRRARPVRTRGD